MKHSFSALVGARIAFLRDSKGFSQNQLSQKSGIPQCLLSKIELEGEITLDNLVKISEALGVNPIELLEKSKTE